MSEFRSLNKYRMVNKYYVISEKTGVQQQQKPPIPHILDTIKQCSKLPQRLRNICFVLITALFTSVSYGANPIVAVYDIVGEVNETGQSSQSFSLTPGRPLTQLELVLSMASAATSPKVKAIIVDADQALLDLSQVQELRRLLLKAREAGKEIWLYTEHFSIKSALLGSAATRFVLMPEADIPFRGLYSESYYFKELLDNIGLKAQVIHIGDFKSAGEELYRTGPSPQAQEQEEKIIDSLYQQILTQIADGRSIERSAIEKILSMPNPRPDDLLRARIVDELSYRTFFVEEAKKHYGYNTKFDRYYRLPRTEGPEVKGFMDLMKQVLKASNTKELKEDHVVIVPLEGMITEQSIVQARAAILRAKNNRHAKALVLRVDSPGGSALASELLWEATNAWKQLGRPFVVSMGGVAASGGYYISAGADRIFAEEATITGSIGVVGMKMVAQEALGKIGVHTHSIQRGKFAGIYSPTRLFSEEETELIKNSMEDVYEVFLRRVSLGRGGNIKGDLRNLAGGRVYSGADALKIGLVDEIGGLNEAINWIISQAKLTDPPIQLSPRPRDGLEAMLNPIPARRPNDEFISMQAEKPQGKAWRQALMKTALPGMHVIENQGVISQLMSQLDALENGHVQLFGPQIHLPLN